MADKSFLDTLLGAFRTNLESDHYDEDLSDERVATIQEASPEAYEKLKEDTGYNDLVGG